MSGDYRYYDDRWRIDPSVKDESLDLSSEFGSSEAIMHEITQVLTVQPTTRQDLERHLTNEMAEVVFGSNQFNRLGADLDETLRLCLLVFSGAGDLGAVERSPGYQAKLEMFLLQNAKPGEKAVPRSRREVVQHAAAFQFLVDAFVKKDQELSEGLIRDTHAIMVKGLSAAEAGVISAKGFAGTYRKKAAYAGSTEMTKPAEISSAMRSLVAGLRHDLAEAENSGHLDPFMLAARYCDRFVNIHPFKDGNGRMCRLILNAILIKYAGVIVPLGEKADDREEYLAVAQESTKVSGHPGQLGTLVVRKAKSAYSKMLKSIVK
ncbi:MAG: hypothetical protein Q9202_007646 [Teloschistes flavicans]